MKHFIDINNFKKTEIDEIIALAKKIKKNPKKYSSSCKNKTLGLIFEKQSLRTRLSFNVGMQKLGGSVLELQGKDIGFDNKREKVEDVLNVLSQYIDCVISKYLLRKPWYSENYSELDLPVLKQFHTRQQGEYYAPNRFRHLQFLPLKKGNP